MANVSNPPIAATQANADGTQSLTGSIRFRFNVITAVLLVALLAGFAWYNQKATESALEGQLREQVSAVTQRLQSSLPATLWNFETEQAKKLAAAEAASDMIAAVYVRNGEGKLVTGQVSGDDGEPQAVNEPGDHTGALTERVPLTYDSGDGGEPVGELEVVADRSTIHEMQQASLVREFAQTLVLVVVLSVALNLLLGRLVLRPLRRVTLALENIASGDGDLTKRLPVSGRGEMSHLAERFNAFVDKIHDAMCHVTESTQQLASASEELTQVASETQTGIQRQTDDTEQIASAINEMTATVQEISRSGSEAEAAASQTDREAQNGGEVVRETIHSIETLASEIEASEAAVDHLAARTREIETVLDVIREVTEQTNLLALNAAIEAARAGEQGRGFAVVAEEVRALARRSGESAEQIREMIEKLVADTQSAVERMHKSREHSDATKARTAQADEALQGIQQSASRIHEQVTQIATAAEEQSQVADEINRNINGIAEVATHSRDSMAQTETSSAELARLGERLRTLVNQFKVHESD